MPDDRRRRLRLVLLLTAFAALAGCKGRTLPGPGGATAYEPLNQVEQAQLREDAIALLLASAASTRAEARANAIEALQQVPERSREALRTALRDENLGVRYVAAVSVGSQRLTNLAAQVRPLLRDESASVRAAAIYALHECGEDVDISPLSTLLMQTDPSLRGNVAFLLGEMGNPTAIPMLHEAARRPMPRVADADFKRVQLQIAESLAKLGDDGALEAIRAALYAPPEQGEIQALAAVMIGRLGDERSVDALIRLTERKEAYLSAEVRLACAGSLAQLGRRQGAFIADMYRDNAHPPLRAQAAFVYGQVGDEANLWILRELLADSSEIVRIYAASAIARITSR